MIMVVTGLTIGPCDETEQPQQTAEIVRISADKLLLEYQGNEIAADQKYRGRILQVSGMATSIGKNILDKPYSALGSGDKWEVGCVQCLFDVKDKKTGSAQEGPTDYYRAQIHWLLVARRTLEKCPLIVQSYFENNEGERRTRPACFSPFSSSCPKMPLYPLSR